MGTERWDRIRDILDAVDGIDPAERDAWIERACSDDPTLLEEVRSLLEAEPEEAFLEPLFDRTPGLAATASHARGPDETPEAAEATGTPKPGQRIGAYQLESELGRGGMGSVWLGHRADGSFEQTVAVKLIAPEQDRGDLTERFLTERRLLANLVHPNVARLYDGGTTEGGQPFFVMEYVRGERIDHWCDRERLTIEERIRLFCKVCDAVHHAHQNLVIHRDIKPSNILVGADGEPKLLDFGIAKLVDTESTGEAVTEHRAMTPHYASPEQIMGETLSTASDIYSLGVLLFELLTGCRPYDLTTASPYELVRIVCETDPARPSTVVDQPTARRDPGSSIEHLANQRRVGPHRLRRLLGGDLESIVLMTLRKEPKRRYPSALEFAEDLQRFLSGWPVKARTDSGAYRLRKFARRHWLGVSSLAAVILALLVAVVGISRQAEIAKGQRDRAREAEKLAGLRLDESERQRAIALAVNDFLNDDLLAAVSPEEQGLEVTVRQVLDQAAERIANRFQDQPLVESEIRRTIGSSYSAIGDYAAALEHLKRHLELRREYEKGRPARIVDAINMLAVLYVKLNRPEEQEPLVREAIAISERELDEHSEERLTAMNNLAMFYTRDQQLPEKGIPILEQLAEIHVELLGELHDSSLRAINNLGNAYYRAGDPNKAEPFLLRARRGSAELHGDTHPLTMSISANLAVLYRRLKRYDDAVGILEANYVSGASVLGEDHPDHLLTRLDLGHVLLLMGRYEEAEGHLVESSEALDATLGKDHHLSVMALSVLAHLRSQQGLEDQAGPLFDDLIARHERIDGPSAAATLGAMRRRAEVFRAADSLDEALALLEEVVALAREAGHMDPGTGGRALLELGYCLMEFDLAEEALNSVAEAYEIYRTSLGDDHASTRHIAQFKARIEAALAR